MNKFIIIGNCNAVTYKEIFPLIKENKLWLGTVSNKTMEFTLDDSYEKWNEIRDGKKIGKVPSITWFTNLEHNKRQQPLQLTKTYNPTEYPKYNNYDAIEVSKVTEIPMDYDGIMGVPITFLSKYCPMQFEIVGSTQRSCHDDVPDTKKYNDYFEISHKTGKPMTQKPNGGKRNENPVLKGKSEGKNYFINADGDCVYSLYSRIFIKRK